MKKMYLIAILAGAALAGNVSASKEGNVSASEEGVVDNVLAIVVKNADKHYPDLSGRREVGSLDQIATTDHGKFAAVDFYCKLMSKAIGMVSSKFGMLDQKLRELIAEVKSRNYQSDLLAGLEFAHKVDAFINANDAYPLFDYVSIISPRYADSVLGQFKLLVGAYKGICVILTEQEETDILTASLARKFEAFSA